MCRVGPKDVESDSPVSGVYRNQNGASILSNEYLHTLVVLYNAVLHIPVGGTLEVMTLLGFLLGICHLPSCTTILFPDNHPPLQSVFSKRFQPTPILILTLKILTGSHSNHTYMRLCYSGPPCRDKSNSNRRPKRPGQAPSPRP